MGYIYNFALQFICIIFIYSLINRRKELYKLVYSSEVKALCVVFALVFAYSLYTGWGGDNKRYQEFVEGGYENFFLLDFFSFEELYVFIAMYTRSFILWKIIVYGSAIFLSIWSIKRLQVDNLITLFSFALIPMSSYGSTRAGLAYSIFLFGYTFLSQNKLYKQAIGLCIVFLSWKAHSSMILPILLTSFTFFKVTKTRMYILLVLFPIMVMLFNKYYLVFLGSSVMDGSISIEKYETYTEGEYATNVSTVGSILRFLFGFVIIPPIYYGMKGMYNKTLDEKYHKICKLSFLMAYISFVIYFSVLDNITFFNRYFTMIPFFLYIVMSGISLEKSVTPNIRKIYMNFVLMYVMIGFMYNLYSNYFV